MNHNCHGDYIEDMKLYRCLRDSSFFAGLDRCPDICPNCQRKVEAIVHSRVLTAR